MACREDAAPPDWLSTRTGDWLSRLVACPRWRWAPGLREAGGYICVQVGDDGLPTLWVTPEGEVIPAESMPMEFFPYPDMDSAGLAYLEDLVIAAFGYDPFAAMVAALESAGTARRNG